ncbi:MAG: putative LPS assembly protein LptD, partial [Siphonobacter sp.]
LLLIFFVVLGWQVAWGQKPAGDRSSRNTVPFGSIKRPVAADSLKPLTAADSAKIKADSLQGESDLKAQVDYFAKDSTIMTADEQIVELFGDAKVDYQDIHLKADYIRLNWQTNEVYAIGRKDSTGKMIGEPIFEQGADVYNTSEIRYNFKSKRAAIKTIVTKQGEGNVRGQIVKKDSANNFYLRGAFYTTCELLHPHYGLKASKIKLVQGKGDNRQVISGPFNLVIAGVQLPLGLPFGFFPFSETRKSGFILGNYGEEPQYRGFYLRDFGYYWAVNDNIGLLFTGQLYSKGSWGAGSQGNYIKRYKYSGSFNVAFNHNKTGDEIGPNKVVSNDFSIQWSHTPQILGRPYSFSASVNVASSNYTQNNEQNLTRYTQNVFGSSVQYSHNFGQYIQTSANLRINQNVTDKSLTASTGVTASVTQFQPFLRKKAVTSAWYESFRVGLTLSSTASITNTISPTLTSNSSYSSDIHISNYVTDTIGTTTSGTAITGKIPVTFANIPTILKNGNITTSFTAPITLPNFKLGRYINVTPGISIQGNVETKRYSYRYAPAGTALWNGTVTDSAGIWVDTTRGAYLTYTYSTSLGINTRAYGTFYFKKLGRLEAIRHTFAPSVSLSYTPDFSNPSYGFYQRVQINERGDSRVISRFTNYSGSIGAAAAASFSLTNQLEMKVRAKTDTAKNQYEKIGLLDNFGLSGSYNFVADSFNLSNLSLVANTVILKKYNISFASTFDPYQIVEDSYYTTGRRVNKLMVADGQGLARLQSMTMGFSTSFKGGGKKKDVKQTASSSLPGGVNPADVQYIQAHPQQYIDWDVPWNLRVSYSYSYSKSGLATPVTYQTASISGDIKLTENWAMTYTSGWDFVANAPSLTNIGLTRNLHCWEASFNWTPIASNQRAGNYSFELRVRSTLLKDLKLSRRKSYSGGF